MTVCLCNNVFVAPSPPCLDEEIASVFDCVMSLTLLMYDDDGFTIEDNVSYGFSNIDFTLYIDFLLMKRENHFLTLV